MKNTKKLQNTLKRALSLSVAILLGLAFAFNSPAAYAANAGQAAMEDTLRERSVSVFVRDRKYTGNAYLWGSVTYVGIREFSMYMGVTSVFWDSSKKTASVKSDRLTISAKSNDKYIIANGRYLWAGSGIIIKNGTMYVPLRTIAKAFGCDIVWKQKEFSAHLSGGKVIESGSSFYDEKDLYWLSRIIHAEASGESLLGKVAVGTVVQNRVKSSEFPNNIHAVIFDKKNGVQFTPTANGAINCTPSAESIIAAKLCLDGASISDKALFFINEALAQSSWVSDNRPFIVAVGNHKFYA